MKATRDDREAHLATTHMPNSGPSWLAITIDAARVEGATLDDVLSMDRSPRAVRARARAWVMLLRAGYSYPEIARGWLLPSHTTVLDRLQLDYPDDVAQRSARTKRRARPALAKARIIAAITTEDAPAAAACG